MNQNIVDQAIFLDHAEARQGTLFSETATLSEGFYNQLARHSVPLEESAIRAINNNSMALDVYAWLAYRLHSLERPTPITWAGLKTQFGHGFALQRQFRVTFLSNLRLSLAVYPAAKVDMDEKGVVLHTSKPPVSVSKIPVTRR